MVTVEEIDTLALELIKPARKNFERRQVIASYPDEIWSADLVDMSKIKNKNKRITFLLNIVDIYSRYAYSLHLKSKSGAEVLKAFESIGRTPKLLWVDEGTEFYNSQVKGWCEKHDVRMYSTHSGLKSVFVERFNRTMKEAFNKQFNAKLTANYFDFLPIFIKKYNETVHSVTKKTPDELYLRGEVSQENPNVKKSATPKFNIGDYVRLSKVKRTFEKGYTNRWTYETFKITNIDENETPTMYEVEDLMGERIEGKMYEYEMLKTKVPFVKIIDSVLKRKTENRKKMVLVNYEGWPEKFDALIPESEYKKWVKFKNEL